MKLFVTGGTGFIGSHFVSAAIKAGHEVLALRREGAVPRILLSQEPNWITAELGTDILTSELALCDALVHLAAAGVVSAETWQSCFQFNVDASLRLLLHASQAGIDRFVVCGSCFEYGRSAERYSFIPVDAPLEPIGPYAASKAAASMAAIGLATERNLQLTVVRPFHVFGEGEYHKRFWPALRAAAISGRDFAMTEGEQIRDFIAVEEVAAKMLFAIENSPAPGRPTIRNIGRGCPQPLRAFADYWWKHWGARGSLLIGKLPYRQNEVMRYVPEL